jgi:Na+-translocating ferredoxin:NAD+ oxidoreductase subunit A
MAQTAAVEGDGLMGTLSHIFVIALGAIFVNNFLLARFLGFCPFMGVTKKTENAIGMGVAVTFVMTLASMATYLVYEYVLRPGDSNLLGAIWPSVRQEGLESILRTISYILVIAALVQFVEMVMRKVSPGLYFAMGIYLPLITTNCAVLGVAVLNTTDAPTRLSFLEATAQGFFAGVGFMLAMLLMSGIREALEHADVPEPLKGLPIAFISTSLMALAFLGFAGMV